MRARFMPSLRLVSNTVLLGLLSSACAETVAPESDESALRSSVAASSDAGHGGQAPLPECLFSVLLTVDEDQLAVSGFTTHSLAQPQASGGTCGKGAPNSVGICYQLDEDGGFAQLWWDGQRVGETSLDDAFLRAGKPAVLTHQTPAGVRYEYHLFTKLRCDSLPGFTLTREQLAAFEH